MAKVATVSKVSTTTVVEGLPKAKPVSLGEIKAKFSQCFNKDTFQEIKALGNKAVGLVSVIEGFTGFALHKAHSGLGHLDTITIKMAGLIEYKADKTVTSKTQQWFDCRAIVQAVDCKSLKDITDIGAYDALAVNIRAKLTELLIEGPARELAKKRAAKTADASPAPAAAGAAAAGAAAAALALAAAAEAAAAFEAYLKRVETLTPWQLEALQAAVQATMAKISPM